MKKYIFLLLCGSILYAGEQDHDTSMLEPDLKKIRLHENSSPFQSISDKRGSRSYTPQEILGMAHFTYVSSKENFTLQSKYFKTSHVQYLIKLLQDDFQTLAKCCDLNQGKDSYLGDNDSIYLEETELTIDYEKNVVEIRRLESNNKGVCISPLNLFDLLQTWKESLHSKHPNLLLIESLDEEYKLIAFYEKELMDEYLTHHPISK